MSVHGPEAITLPVVPSASRDEAARRFLRDLGDWIAACRRDYGDLPPSDVHDQATYATSWAPYVLTTGEASALQFMQGLRDQIHAHFTGAGVWRHGYWRKAEVHHGTEHFELFLGALWRLSPDEETARQILDAAEHLGNWVREVPEWFDWQTGLFRSFYLGTDFVGLEPDQRLNVPDHFRCLNLALLAHEVGGEQRYLDLAVAHGTRWGEAIVGDGPLPSGLAPEGIQRGDLDANAEQAYRSFAGMASHSADELGRAENLFASGAVEALLRLWELTGDPRFRRAAERLLDVIAPEVAQPEAGPAAHSVRNYRRVTGDARYDVAVLEAVAGVPEPVTQLTMRPHVKRASRPPGIGTRTDMPEWLENGQPRRRNPITLSVAAEITDNERLAIEALDLARTYFALARQAYPHGRDHGCSARTVSAIARGHGRDNGAGMVTAVLAPLLAA